MEDIGTNLRYRYSPPKSNIWGHSLRKMLPSLQEKKTEEFLSTLSTQIKTSSYYLTFFSPSNINDLERKEYLELIAIFEKTLDIPNYDESRLSYLSEDQFNLGLDLLKSLEKKPHHPWIGATIQRGLKIDRWQINGISVPTEASLGFHFGFSPHIGTEMIFNNESEFQFVADQFYTSFKVRLNPKHLKPLRGSMKNYHLWR